MEDINTMQVIGYVAALLSPLGVMALTSIATDKWQFFVIPVLPVAFWAFGWPVAAVLALVGQIGGLLYIRREIFQ